MSDLRPGALSVRALNEYRRRDVMTYLSLRYYLHNTSAQTDNWARHVATDLVLGRTEASYLRVNHFKEMTNSGHVLHREIFLPGANEAMAEAALLDECAKYPQAFASPSCVFSYKLNNGADRSGIFENYVVGLRGRHQSIAEACEANPNGVAGYSDIKRFYPSISIDLVVKAWHRQSDLAGLPSNYRELGEKLITDYQSGSPMAGKEILTGPIFSHLLGNLVLRELDQDFSESLPARYFRYVDDFVLVGSRSEVNSSEAMLRKRLNHLGLDLHDDTSPKHIEVSTEDWLKGRNDFDDSRSLVSWVTLIGNLKRFIIANPRQRENLQEAFRSENFRVPVRDYSRLANERDYLDVLNRLASQPWFRRKSKIFPIQTLLEQARWLRERYEQEFQSLSDGVESLNGFERKRRTPQLRYRAGRLIYLATDDRLELLFKIAKELPELHYHAHIMDAVATGNIDRLLPLGTNAAQAVAQSLRATGKRCVSTIPNLSDVEDQALAIFHINGVPVDRPSTTATAGSDLMRFAKVGADIDLMKHAEPFIRELSCLHGITERPRHPEIFDLVYDEDEDLAMDAIDQLHQSLS